MYTPSEFIELCNHSLEYAYGNITIEGEVASFKINQGKWVFFDVKDEFSSVGCFMTLYQMRMPLEDGMKVQVRGTPKVTAWGKFSFTVRQVVPVGEGNIKKSFEILKAKLKKEGLFAPERKRPLPESVATIGVISSTQAAGYADFIKIVNERWGGLCIRVAHTQVQGLAAADQIIRALKYFNERGEVEVIAILRGGGSADDLAVFNDEQLVRAVAASKIPVITGIGHEVDESLADLAADVQASTPSNVAQMLTPDKRAVMAGVRADVGRVQGFILDKIDGQAAETRLRIDGARQAVALKVDTALGEIRQKIKLLERLDPEAVLAQGYAVVTGRLQPGSVVKITTQSQTAEAEVKSVKERKENVNEN